ncbi:MAG: aminopeptidase, partial [Chloroflexota bacterium]
MTLSFEHKLQNYADLSVRVGVGLQAGQTLLIRAPLESVVLVQKIVESAYQAGAALVDVLWTDDALTLARYQYAPRDSFEMYPNWNTDALNQVAEQGGALLSIYAADPDLLKDQDPELIATAQRVQNEHMAPFRRMAMTNMVNWSIVSYPIPAWAAKIFPDVSADEQIAQLWDVIFNVCRVDQTDPIMVWHQHNQLLKELGIS